jgi:hypothetical protein
VELKGDGGYVIWWPREGFPVEDHPLADWPDWLRAEIGARENNTGRGSASPIEHPEARARSIAKVVLNDPTEKALYWAASRYSEMIKWGFPIDRARKFLDAVSPYVKIRDEAVRTSIANGFANTDRRIEGLLRRLATAEAGTRNSTLYWVAIELSHLTPDYHELLVEAAIQSGLPQHEIEATISSAIQTRNRGLASCEHPAS